MKNRKQTACEITVYPPTKYFKKGRISYHCMNRGYRCDFFEASDAEDEHDVCKHVTEKSIGFYELCGNEECKESALEFARNVVNGEGLMKTE